MNMNINRNQLIELSETISVSGFEQETVGWFRHNLEAVAGSCRTDLMGNALCSLEGSAKGKKIMIEAHADEVGFQVVHIADNGNLYLRRNGGVDEQCLPGSEVVVCSSSGQRIHGVIGKRPIHLMGQDDRKRTFELSQLWVDTGLDADDVKAKIAVGDCVAHRPNWRFAGEFRITGKSIDNKIGVYVITRVMQNLNSMRPLLNTVIAAATSQEEVGSRGAVVAAYAEHPDIAVTVDMDFATDTPDCPECKYGRVELGKGPVIPLNVDCDTALSQMLKNIAIQNGIPFQMSARPHATGGTNISRIQLVQNGIHTISLGLPCRYMHTPVEMCDLRDIDAAINLLTHFVTAPH